MKRVLVALAVMAAVWASMPGAWAHPVTSFTACAVKPHGTRCGQDVVYKLGDTIRVRGHVTPPHASLRAQVWREKPSQRSFHRIGSVAIGDHGAMHFVWHTSVQDDPGEAQYKFQFRIPGHGKSNVVRLWLLF